MPVGPGVARATFQGRLGGSEIALFGFHVRLADVVAIDDEDEQAVADKIRDSWLDAFGTAKDLFSGALTLEAVRCDWLDNTPGLGYLKTRSVSIAEFASSGTGSFIVTGASLPWECALVVSLAAYAPGGFAINEGRKRGRYYLPALPGSIITGTEGQLADTAVTAYADRVADFHETVNDQVSPELPNQLRTVVLSRADDTTWDVQHLWVDSKVDSQRRRENRQPALFRQTRTLDA